MSEISKIYDALNDIPVDRLAASMFWKTPWWAELPETVALPVAKAVLEERMSPEKIAIDYFKRAPIRVSDRGEKSTPGDLRGTKLRFPDGKTGIITGYAHCKEAELNANKANLNRKKPWWFVGNNWNPKTQKKKVLKHYWFAFVDDNYFSIVSQRTLYRIKDHEA